LEENRLACPIQQRHKNKLADRQTGTLLSLAMETLQIPVFSVCYQTAGDFATLSTETPLNACGAQLSVLDRCVPLDACISHSSPKNNLHFSAGIQ
jgi:hypothetical protein